MQALVRPYLDSKFSLKSAQTLPKGVLFGSPRGSTFAKWMYNWPRQLTMNHATGEALRKDASMLKAFLEIALHMRHALDSADAANTRDKQ